MGAPKGLLYAVASELRRAKMEGEKRERWMRLCVDVADEQDLNRLLELISEIDRLLREKEMRLRNVLREASRYVIEAAEKEAS